MCAQLHHVLWSIFQSRTIFRNLQVLVQDHAGVQLGVFIILDASKMLACDNRVFIRTHSNNYSPLCNLKQYIYSC